LPSGLEIGNPSQKDILASNLQRRAEVGTVKGQNQGRSATISTSYSSIILTAEPAEPQRTVFKRIVAALLVKYIATSWD
jgi:hypothetical protein